MKRGIYNFLLATVVVLLSSAAVNAQPKFEQFYHDNRTRSFYIYTPKDFDISENLPLIINMHGFTQLAVNQMNYTEMNGLADTARCIVIYPSGINRRWNSGTFFTLESNVDDIGFISSLIDYAAVKYNANTKKVYATGHSAGGFMSYKLACDVTNKITAIAPVVGSMVPDNFNSCLPDRAVPVMAFNGTADRTTEFNGLSILGMEMTKPIEEVIDLWLNSNGCDSVYMDTLPNIKMVDGSRVVQITHTNCNESVEVILMKVLNGGHTWPGAKPFDIIGKTNQDISANQVMWDFFNAYTMPNDIICAAPVNIVATTMGDSILIEWDGSAAAYAVYHDFYNNGEWTPIRGITSNRLIIANNDTINDGSTPLVAVMAECNSGYGNWAVARPDIVSPIFNNRIELFSVYPNPSIGIFKIDGNQNSKQEVIIYNLSGKVVTTVVIGDDNNVNVEFLNNGVYFLRLENSVSKIVIEK